MGSVEDFAILDRVRWNDEAPIIVLSIREMTERYGGGPFTVMATQEIPEDECACGHSTDHPKHGQKIFEDVCQWTMREIAGHHQRVRVMDATGKMIGDTYFSGLWFKKINVNIKR